MLAEALWWAVSVGDGFKGLAALQRFGWPNNGAYRNDRDNDPDGRVLEGVRYARDRCGHQLAIPPPEYARPRVSLEAFGPAPAADRQERLR
jgi:hypothetical protein